MLFKKSIKREKGVEIVIDYRGRMMKATPIPIPELLNKKARTRYEYAGAGMNHKKQNETTGAIYDY